MTEKFNGFSQDEIKKLSVPKASNSSEPATDTMKQAFKGHSGIRRMPEKWTKPISGNIRKQQQQPVMPSTNTAAASGVAKDLTDESVEEINIDSSMSKSIEEALFYQPMGKIRNGDVINPLNGATPATSTSEVNNSSLLKLPMESNVSSSTFDDSSILCGQQAGTAAPTHFSENLNVDSPFKGISLKDFESHRKMIQEQNKQKKELLSKAIEHHSQKTAAEARKIEEIKIELAKLDSDIAVDVAILRKEIDIACVHFANIEKQYTKIEAQFLKAKIELHNAAEKKELLTEHLYTVIAHNEDSKAQKLSELMQKVGLSPLGDYDCLPTTTNFGETIDK